MTVAQRQKLTDSVWIASALFGFVGFSDPIPAYRLSGETSLPGIGTLARFWRAHLPSLLAKESELVLYYGPGNKSRAGHSSMPQGQGRMH